MATNYGASQVARVSHCLKDEAVAKQELVTTGTNKPMAYRRREGQRETEQQELVTTGTNKPMAYRRREGQRETEH